MSSSHTLLSDHSPYTQYFKPTLSAQMPLETPSFGGVSLPQDLIYLDHAAATPVDTRVLAKMMPWMTHYYGNPANRLHPMGEIAEYGLAQARQTVADAIGADFDEIIFCSSATEANNLFLRGLVEHPLRKRNKIIVASTEHSSILSTAQDLADRGIEVILLPVDSMGQIVRSAAELLIDDKTLCVCVMDVNNETGIHQQQLQKVITLAHQMGALVHVDAVQGFARSSFHKSSCNFDTATLSGAKIYAGRGAAALIVRKRTPRIRIRAQLTGGGHEAGLRSGTPHLAAIVGFAEAARLQVAERSERLHYLSHLESIFLSTLAGHIDFVRAGENCPKAAGILMLHISGVNAMKLIENMKHVCVSSGSACRTLQATTSHVLKAMGQEEDVALASFRVSIGLTNTEAEMQTAARAIADAALALRKTSANLLS